jgi:putative tricarboxylic transport membrane protein
MILNKKYPHSGMASCRLFSRHHPNIINPTKPYQRQEDKMKKARTMRLIPTILFLVVLTLAAPVNAAYPEKPIEFVIHSAPGGGMDVFTRTVANVLEKSGIVKQKIQVTNRRGGGATVAINYVVDKKGDPYVLQHWTTSPLNTLLRGTTKVKSWKDLTIIGTLVEDPNVAVGQKNSPYKDLGEAIADAKKNPNKVSAGIQTIGGSEHIICHRIEKAAGVQLNITSFDKAVVSLLGGHIDMAFDTVAVTLPQVEGGKLKFLATTTQNRIPFLPDVPTLKDLGINASFTQYRGFWGGPGFPEYAVKFWEDAFAKLMETKEWKDFMQRGNMIPTYMTAAETVKFLGPYYEELRQDVKELEAFKKKK